MAREYYPWANGNGGTATDGQWRKMARLWAASGVERGLAVSAGSGNNLNLSAGSAWIDGYYYEETTNTTVAFANNTLAQPQIVYVVVQVDPVARTVTPKCQTTPPQAVRSGVYDLLLAEFTLPPSGTAQTPTGMADRRVGIDAKGVWAETANGASGTYYQNGGSFSLDAGASNLAGGITVTGSGGIVLPGGLWQIERYGDYGSVLANGRSFIELQPAGGRVKRASLAVGEQTGGVSLTVRVPPGSTRVVTMGFMHTAASAWTYNGVLEITRVGGVA